MRKMLLIAVAAALLLALSVQPAEVRAGSPCTVPASWGALRSVFTPYAGVTFMAFEDSAGMVHVLNRNKCEVETDREVTRTP